MDQNRTFAYVMLVLTVAAWGLATPVIKYTVEYVPPLTFLMLRFWISALFAIPAALYFLRKIKLNKERLKKIASASFIGHILALTFLFLGLEKTSSIDGSIITSLSPLLITLLAFFILKEHITKKEIKGTLIALIGTFIIIFEPLATGSGDYSLARMNFIGNLLFIIGILADAFYSIYVKKNLADDKIVTPFIQIVFSFIFAAIVFTPLGFLEQYHLYSKTENGVLRSCTSVDIDKYNYSKGTICNAKGCYPTPKAEEYFCLQPDAKVSFSAYFKQNLISYNTGYALAGIAYMALISGVFAYIAFNFGLKHIEASEASVFYYLQPIFGIPAAVLMLNESYSLTLIIGSLVIISGIYIVEKR